MGIVLLVEMKLTPDIHGHDRESSPVEIVDHRGQEKQGRDDPAQLGNLHRVLRYRSPVEARALQNVRVPLKPFGQKSGHTRSDPVFL